MKRVLETVLVGLALGSSLVACVPAGDPPTPVTIVSKEIEPAEMESKKVKDCKGWKARKPHTDANCSNWGTKTVTEWDDQDFVLHLSDGREVDVSEEDYNKWQEGQTYNG
jgi:hypothetical protein